MNDPVEAKSPTFEKEIEYLINRHSQENASDTPDWILAQYLVACLASFAVATQQRENWYRRDPRPTAPAEKPEPEVK